MTFMLANEIRTNDWGGNEELFGCGDSQRRIRRIKEVKAVSN
jgi:hypothetical protein